MNAAKKEPSFAEAVAELAHLSGWPKEDVIAKPHDAYWAASGLLARFKDVVVAGDRR